MTPTKKLLAGVTALGLVVTIAACMEYKGGSKLPHSKKG